MLYCVAKILLCDTDKDSESKKGDIINGTLQNVTLQNVTTIKCYLSKRHQHNVNTKRHQLQNVTNRKLHQYKTLLISYFPFFN
jgi:hypothetical protein